MVEEITCSECGNGIKAVPKVEHGTVVFYGALESLGGILDPEMCHWRPEPWECPHCDASFEHLISVKKLNEARELVGLPVFFIRLNEDASLSAPVRHLERVSPTKVRVLDTAVFTPDRWPEKGIRLVMLELLDTRGTVWAMRRLPEHLSPVLTRAHQFQVNWELTITEEDFVGVESIG
jgi:hypothetical protein